MQVKFNKPYLLQAKWHGENTHAYDTIHKICDIWRVPFHLPSAINYKTTKDMLHSKSNLERKLANVTTDA